MGSVWDPGANSLTKVIRLPWSAAPGSEIRGCCDTVKFVRNMQRIGKAQDVAGHFLAFAFC